MKIITVRPGDNLVPDEIALWERHEDHPGGEAWLVQGGEPIQVAQTPRVEERLADGRLERAATGEGG